MTIALIEGPPRSVGAGVGYNTDIGLGARTFWEDRNLFGEGEDLRLSAGAAQKQLGVAANFRRPDFLENKQDLIANAELLRQTTSAYQSRREDAYLGLEELMFPPYTLGGGSRSSVPLSPSRAAMRTISWSARPSTCATTPRTICSIPHSAHARR